MSSDLLQKWLTGVMTAATMALIAAAFSLWTRVAALESWRTDTLPLTLAVDRAQLGTTINAIEIQGMRVEMRVEEVHQDIRELETRVRGLEDQR